MRQPDQAEVKIMSTLAKSFRIKSPPPSSESWVLCSTDRRLPPPDFPIIPNENPTTPGREITAIADGLWHAFHHCYEAATEKEAGNHFLVLAHDKLHARLNSLRVPFLQEAKAAGIYLEAAVAFDKVAHTLRNFRSF